MNGYKKTEQDNTSVDNSVNNYYISYNRKHIILFKEDVVSRTADVYFFVDIN